MAKRPTIGRNPLDTLVAESHLDSVVPDLVTSPPQPGAPPKPEAMGDLQSLLAAREAENQRLQKELDKLKAQVKELKERLAQAEPRWVTLRRLSES
jgi:predicted  nucleic acid-binding Zn-ribbon protein